MTEHGPKLHATLGASACYRWRECPGSVALTANLEDKGSDFAAEGTAAHALGELCLTNGKDASAYLGVWIDADAEKFFQAKPNRGRVFEVTEEMAEAVQLYLDVVRVDVKSGCQLLVEQRFDLTKYGPGEPMFGTADAVVYDPANKALSVYDLKYGRGVAVEARSGGGSGLEGVNPQALYYALGATLSLPLNLDVTVVEVIIVQPRAPHRDGPVRRAIVDAYDLLCWKADLMDAARRTQSPGAPLAAGSWCRFCGAAGFCPKLRDKSIESAMLEFSSDVSGLTPDETARILNAADDIEGWIKAVRGYAYGLLESGKSITGWKLVPKRATRKWADEDAAETAETAETAGTLKLLGLTDDQLFTKKLGTPAQIEKLLPKEDRKALGALTVKESSGSTMARDDDVRTGVPGSRNAQDQFND